MLFFFYDCKKKKKKRARVLSTRYYKVGSFARIWIVELMMEMIVDCVPCGWLVWFRRIGSFGLKKKKTEVHTQVVLCTTIKK